MSRCSVTSVAVISAFIALPPLTVDADDHRLQGDIPAAFGDGLANHDIEAAAAGNLHNGHRDAFHLPGVKICAIFST